jgi:predicted NUDIX family NTP pyrophosphohydrolase
VPKPSAGLLLFRQRDGGTEVLLVHPGGPFWAKKDEGAWMIPKGEINEGEAPLAAARREFQEETGGDPGGDAVPLPPLLQAGGKLVHAFAVRGDFDPATLCSNSFSMEWPPRSGRQASFPEVDRAAWLTLAEARRSILPSQRPLLDALERLLAE